MKRVSKYKILKEQKLIILFNQGNVDVNDIKLCRGRIIKDKDFSPSYNLILDLRLSQLSTNIYDVREFGLFISKNRKLDKKSLKVLLTNTPEQVVYTTILKGSIENDGYSYEVYSTLTGGLNYLGVPIEDFNLVNDEIEQMIED